MAIESEIAGYGEFVGWCGGWPSFHDAEIVRLELDRAGSSRLVIRVLGGPKPTIGPRSDCRYCSPPTDLLVTFVLEEIEDLELEGFSHQNVIFGLELKQNNGLFELEMDPCFGLSGRLAARKVAIEFQPQRVMD